MKLSFIWLLYPSIWERTYFEERGKSTDYGDNINSGVKLNLSFESSQMTSRLPPSGLEEL